MILHIFNPENDMALANGTPGYVAPESARQMRHDLRWLPKWWCADEDQVWDNESPLHLQEGDRIEPWGWSPALVHELKKAGVEDKFMPGSDEIKQIRALSHRQTAVKALEDMRADGLIGNALCGHSTLCHTEKEVVDALGQYPQCILKAPWSCSGKGVRNSEDVHIMEWARNIIRQQGSVVVEERLEKLSDFALLFSLNEKGVEYQGLSLFNTDKNGAYMGNWLAPEAQKFQWLMQYVSPQDLIQIRKWWENYLLQFPYRGPVGVDMMLCSQGICPCVEINWRMTMGLVAEYLTRQGRTGKFKVEYIYGQYSADIEDFG